MLKGKSTPARVEKVKKELAHTMKIIIGHRSIEQFMQQHRITDIQIVTNLFKGKICELPDRKILRKLASASEGRITHLYMYDLCGYSEQDPEEDRTWAEWTPKRGDLFMCDLGMYGLDCEQQGERPFLIISNDKGNTHGSIVVGIPLTRRGKNPKIHIPIGKEFGVRENSFAMAEHIRSVSKRRFFYTGLGFPWKIGTISEEKMLEVQNALEFELGFEPLMFDEDKAFKMVEHIKSLEKNIKVKQSRDLIDLLNDKVDEFALYCKKYNKNYKHIFNEYNRINNYAYEAI